MVLNHLVNGRILQAGVSDFFPSEVKVVREDDIIFWRLTQKTEIESLHFTEMNSIGLGRFVMVL